MFIIFIKLLDIWYWFFASIMWASKHFFVQIFKHTVHDFTISTICYAPIHKYIYTVFVLPFSNFSSSEEPSIQFPFIFNLITNPLENVIFMSKVFSCSFHMHYTLCYMFRDFFDDVIFYILYLYCAVFLQELKRGNCYRNTLIGFVF